MTKRILYTDGSYKNDKASCAWIWLNCKNDILDKGAENIAPTSSYIAELCGIAYGLERIPCGTTKILVLTDSLDCVRLWNGTKKRRRARNRYYEEDVLSHKHNPIQIEFRHVKGHSTSRWNNMADSMAGALTK
jgi:ribonuclease HI